jgi:multidrug efflux system outer membrane protein
VVFLSLAALYESWFIPISVIMVVPLGVLGALAAAFAFGMENDVYFQVGLLTTIGLSAKNAILIVEFARNLNAAGRSLVDAALEAAQLRLRPIVMTSMAFMLGVLPLALATGAGSASRNAIGTGVIGGMLTATFLAPFLVPMFFVVIGKRFAALGAVAVAAVALSGCSLEPAYTRPGSLPASRYPTGAAYESDAAEPLGNRTAPADIGWRDFFSDPYLQQLVETALRNNRDLRVAMLTVESLQAQYRITTAALFPRASAYAERDRSRTPADLSKNGVASTTGSYAIGASLSWELDFFGQLRSLRHAALEQYLASIEGRRAAQLLIVSEVAQDYLALLACDDLLKVTDQTLAAASESYRLVKLQFDVGNGSELDVRQAETVVEQARANRAAQLRARAQAENALMQLIGVQLPPGRDNGRSLTDQNLLENLPAGLPSELLSRRPDVLQAEGLIRAANADIGAARAAFFPSVSLTGSGGTASAALDGLFKAGSAAWSVAPSVLTTLFDAGTNRANLDVARVRNEIAIAQYQKTVHAAFREVADGLAASGTFQDQLASLERYTEAQRRRLELAVLLYRNGESSYLDVLTAQTDLYDAQLVLVDARLERLTNLVVLYRALGGGWLEHTVRRP